jgi:hypothetical protein
METTTSGLARPQMRVSADRDRSDRTIMITGIGDVIT